MKWAKVRKRGENQKKGESWHGSFTRLSLTFGYAADSGPINPPSNIL